jgi:hypothetical protein
MDRDRLADFLRAHTVLTLAVTNSDGTPYAAALFYAVDEDLLLYVLTDPATQHGRAMLACDAVAGTIQADGQPWESITGVQFRGRCRPLSGEKQAKASKIYTAKFRFLRQENPTLSSALARTELWCIETDWIRLIDNRLRFGHHEEWTRPQS